MRRFLLTVVIALAVVVTLTQPADATFPGRNGRIAYMDAGLSRTISTITPNGSKPTSPT
jgi:hypothetical protein